MASRLTRIEVGSLVHGRSTLTGSATYAGDMRADRLIEAALTFAGNLFFPRLSHRLRWFTRLGPGGSLAYVLTRIGFGVSLTGFVRRTAGRPGAAAQPKLYAGCADSDSGNSLRNLLAARRSPSMVIAPARSASASPTRSHSTAPSVIGSAEIVASASGASPRSRSSSPPATRARNT